MAAYLESIGINGGKVVFNGLYNKADNMNTSDISEVCKICDSIGMYTCGSKIYSEEIKSILDSQKVITCIEYSEKNREYYFDINLDKYTEISDKIIVTEEELNSNISITLKTYKKDGEVNGITIPDFVEVIGYGAFFGVSIKGKIKANRITRVTGAFSGYKGEELDLTEFDMSKIRRLNGMISSCHNLRKVDFGEQEPIKLASVRDFISNCPCIEYIGIKGFKLDENCGSMLEYLYDENVKVGSPDKIIIEIGKEYKVNTLKNIELLRKYNYEIIEIGDINASVINRAMALKSGKRFIFVKAS